MRHVAAGVSSEYEAAVRQIKDARESDVVEKALTAARERLGMDAAYIATVDSREQTIEVMVGETNAEALVEGAVIPVDQTYCARMLTGEIPNIVLGDSLGVGLAEASHLQNLAHDSVHIRGPKAVDQIHLALILGAGNKLQRRHGGKSPIVA